MVEIDLLDPIIEMHRYRDQRDQMRRLFNRLEAAISHHKKATADFPQTCDEALYKARDKILKDYANGNG